MGWWTILSIGRVVVDVLAEHELLVFVGRMNRPVNLFGPRSGLPMVGLGSLGVKCP